MISSTRSFKLISLIVISLFASTAQIRDEQEKRISFLPADQRAFERFRLWVAGQPVSLRGSEGVIHNYRMYLKTGGFSDAEIAAQLDMIKKQSGRLEAERWNR